MNFRIIDKQLLVNVGFSFAVFVCGLASLRYGPPFLTEMGASAAEQTHVPTFVLMAVVLAFNCWWEFMRRAAGPKGHGPNKD